MIDTTLLFEDRTNRTYHILGRPGTWTYERIEGEFRSRKFIFSRPHLKDPDRQVEIAISNNILQTRVFETTPHMDRTQNFRIDLERLEAFQE